MRSMRFILYEVGIGLRRNLTMTVALVITVVVSLVPARRRRCWCARRSTP